MHLIEIEKSIIAAGATGATLSLKYHGYDRIVIPIAYGWTRAKNGKPSKLMMLCYRIVDGEHRLRIYELINISDAYADLPGSAPQFSDWHRDDLTLIFHELMWKYPPAWFVKPSRPSYNGGTGHHDLSYSDADSGL